MWRPLRDVRHSSKLENRSENCMKKCGKEFRFRYKSDRSDSSRYYRTVRLLHSRPAERQERSRRL